MRNLTPLATVVIVGRITAMILLVMPVSAVVITVVKEVMVAMTTK